MDAITLLKEDHKTVEKLFKRFEGAGDDAHVLKREIVDQIIEELSIHAAIEEQLFYPATRATVPAVEDVARESLEEHHIVKWVLSELERMDPEDERFDAKVSVLMENVRHHVEEEEDEYFPKVRDELGRNALNDLGDAMESAKKTAPTHPHPRSPDRAPANLVTGPAAAVVDRVSDTVGGIAQGGVSALSDLIARLTNNKKPKTSPRGSKTARSTARKVRARASGAAKTTGKTTKATTRSAARGAAKTTKAAKSGAKATGTSARKGAKRTTTTAKRAATTAKRRTGTAKSGAKATATSARKAGKRTKTTAKRAATTTGRTARKAASSTRSTAKRVAKTAKRSTKRPTKRS